MVGIRNIILEGDSSQVVHAISSFSNDWSWFGHLVEDTRKVLHSLLRWKCVHVNRDINHVAHKLAKLAIHHVLDKVWLKETPDCIHDVILMERSDPPSINI